MESQSDTTEQLHNSKRDMTAKFNFNPESDPRLGKNFLLIINFNNKNYYFPPMSFIATLYKYRKSVYTVVFLVVKDISGSIGEI